MEITGEVAEQEKASPFDVAGVELGHRGEACSFDAIVHEQKTPGLARAGPGVALI